MSHPGISKLSGVGDVFAGVEQCIVKPGEEVVWSCIVVPGGEVVLLPTLMQQIRAFWDA